MPNRIITEPLLEDFRRYLISEERSAGTIEKYLRDIRAFSSYAEGRGVTKELMILWKESLGERGYAPVTINSMLSSLNVLFRFLHWDDCQVKFLRVQRRVFRDPSRELTKAEYYRLVETARDHGRERLALIMETICSAGIRVSEVRFITLEAVKSHTTDVYLKGKVRTITLPGKLCKKLIKYARAHHISSGVIFRTRSGKPLSRKQIWAEMKSLCEAAGISPSKVFPHNLRHLFARTFYRMHRDIVKLADTLGHSSIDTTRIYLISTGEEHRSLIERLRLVT